MLSFSIFTPVEKRVQIENHRCFHITNIPVNTTGGISLLALLVISTTQIREPYSPRMQYQIVILAQLRVDNAVAVIVIVCKCMIWHLSSQSQYILTLKQLAINQRVQKENPRCIHITKHTCEHNWWYLSLDSTTHLYHQAYFIINLAHHFQ